MTEETLANYFLRLTEPLMEELEEKFIQLLDETEIMVEKASLAAWEDMAAEDEQGLLERLSGNGN